MIVLISTHFVFITTTKKKKKKKKEKKEAFSIINIVKTKFHNLNYYLVLYFKRKIILNLVFINNCRLFLGFKKKLLRQIIDLKCLEKQLFYVYFLIFIFLILNEC